MKVYLQGNDGEEIELDVIEPDPKDGTFIASLSKFSFDVLFRAESMWIRVCPDKSE